MHFYYKPAIPLILTLLLIERDSPFAALECEVYISRPNKPPPRIPLMIDNPRALTTEPEPWTNQQENARLYKLPLATDASMENSKSTGCCDSADVHGKLKIMPLLLEKNSKALKRSRLLLLPLSCLEFVNV